MLVRPATKSEKSLPKMAAFTFGLGTLIPVTVVSWLYAFVKLEEFWFEHQMRKTRNKTL